MPPFVPDIAPKRGHNLRAWLLTDPGVPADWPRGYFTVPHAAQTPLAASCAPAAISGGGTFLSSFHEAGYDQD